MWTGCTPVVLFLSPHILAVLVMAHYIPEVIHLSSHFDIPILAIVEW